MEGSDRFVVLIGLLVLGAWGWGRAAVTVFRRIGWERAALVIGAPLQILLGVSLFLSVGGFFVAGGVAHFGVLVAWHLIGVLFLTGSLVAAVRRTREIRLRPVLLTAAGAVVAVCLFFVSISNALHLAQSNINDDDGAYIYLAKRLLTTGGLIDPFNQRRLTSYGGNTLYHALFLHMAGNSAVQGFEFVFAALILVLAVIGTVKRRFLIPGAILVGVGVLLGHGAGPIINLSPEYSVAALSLGAYQLLRHVGPDSRDEHSLLYVVIGFFLASILALRFTFLISVMAALVIVLVALHGRRSIRPLAITSASMVTVTFGWAIASLRSSGTPLFPLVAGNYNTSWPGGRDPTITGLGKYAQIFGSAFNYGDVGTIALLSALIGLALFLFTRRESVPMLVLLSAGIGCLVQLAILAYMFSGSDARDIARFEGPSTLACGLLAIDTLWLRRRDPRRVRPSLPLRGLDAPRLDSSQANLGRAGVSSAITVLLLLMAAITFGYSFSSARSWFDGTRSSIRTGYEIVYHPHNFIDRYASVGHEYRRLNAMVPAGTKVLTAVPYPALLGFSKYQFATLDLAGGASPPPHMPFFRGTRAKVAYLRALGYEYIVAEAQDALGLYQQRAWLKALRGSIYAYRAWTPYFLDWQRTINELEQNQPLAVRYAGSLALIRIH